ncbi:RagB/SusD family nutrient uptake outer membrane protein [Niabella sp.]|uniref:RagB/SusD family nutrient uptake outer membrane protein n=1 Tax=Niabella sp. TaxID=1962976 RepID=UPI002621DA6B|nr:RagB/SusD family nutrient uptake outer membrane protein [Niabella sp.]
MRFFIHKYSVRLVLVLLLAGSWGCNKFLNIVPNDMPSLESAFSNRAVMERYMRTCYSALPDATDPFFYPAYFSSWDELDVTRDSRSSNNSMAGLIAQGRQNSNAPYQDYWTGSNGGKPLYQGIRECNIFLDNAHMPHDITEQERTRWISEVKFLKAYYHFFLLELYGPIVLVKENHDISDDPASLREYREPVDECVDYIVQLIDEAMPGLPAVLPDPPSEMGRISQVIALAVKAKVLATAASPLFNGNTDYAGWVDGRGKQLISPTYSPAKWQRAATAIKEAIDAAEENGGRLYTFNKFSGTTYGMNDSVAQLMTIRKAVTEDLDKNPGVIWATQEQFADGKGGSSWFAPLGNMVKSLFPAMFTTDQPSYVGYLTASWHMAELFYSNKGVPIEEDKYFDYANRYKPRRATGTDNVASYIPTGEITASMHFFREPRFYADLGFDRGFFELATNTTDAGASYNVYLKSRPAELSGATSSYAAKKIIHYETAASKGIANTLYAQRNYQFPLLRLSDLYLLYSEALNEVKSQPDNDVYLWIDKVRAAAGLKGVVQSWQEASFNPGAPTTKEGMRRIIQRERLIELAFEGQRFWDVRRWKTADKYWSLRPTTWSLTASQPDQFYVPVQSTLSRVVTFRDYLFPIRKSELRVNTNLVQTYGW